MILKVRTKKDLHIYFNEDPKADIIPEGSEAFGFMNREGVNLIFEKTDKDPVNWYLLEGDFEIIEKYDFTFKDAVKAAFDSRDNVRENPEDKWPNVKDFSNTDTSKIYQDRLTVRSFLGNPKEVIIKYGDQ